MGAVTSLFVRKMVAAVDAGPDHAALLRSVGLEPDAPVDPKAMIADTVYYDLLERIAAKSDVTDLPLRTGASMRCDDYGALGLAFKAAPTLHGSFERIVRYGRLWTSVVEYELRPAGDAIWFVLHRAGPPRLGLRLSNEATLASATAISREVSATQTFTPLEVHFSHPAPRSIKAHQAYFGGRLVFGSDRTALLVSRASLEQANSLGDTGITQFLLGHLEQELAHLAPAKPVTDATQDVIARALSDGLPKMEDVARRLGLSVRSLHRRLAEEGLTYQTLAETTRRDLAEGLLRDTGYSLAEIAFLTGFAEQSSFNRAFKRWVGRTPARYRKERPPAL